MRGSSAKFKETDTMKLLREASIAELDLLFSQITAEAAKAALSANLDITGTDQHDRTVKSKSAELPDPPKEKKVHALA
jgi:hypothetical protein